MSQVIILKNPLKSRNIILFGAWKGTCIFGIWDLNKIQGRKWDLGKYLEGNGIHWGFDCIYRGSRIHKNLGTGCGIFLPVCWKFRKSYVLAANVNQLGEHTVVSPIKANYPNCQVINRRADRRPTGMVKLKTRKAHLPLA